MTETQNFTNNPLIVPSESEQALLGLLLRDGELMLELESLKAEDFFFLSNQALFNAMTGLQAQGTTINTFSVMQWFIDRNESHLAGKPIAAFCAELFAQAPHSAEISEIVERVQAARARRDILQNADNLKAETLRPELSIADLRDFAVASFSVTDVTENSPVTSMSDEMSDYFDQLEATQNAQPGISGLSSGYNDYDLILDGFQEKSLNIIAGRPGSGKSAFAANIILRVAKAGGGVYWWSGEMPKKQMRERLVSIETGIFNTKLRRGLRPNGMNQLDWSIAVNALGQLSKLPIFFDDKSNITPEQMRSRIKRIHRKTPIALIVADYLGLINTAQRFEKKTLELEYITRFFKSSIAGEIAPVLLLAQLNRGVESRSNKRPMLSDLRDSGAIEQDADTVTFIYRDDMYDPMSADAGMSENIVAKNRHGSTGTAMLGFEGSTLRFKDTQTIQLFEEAGV